MMSLLALLTGILGGAPAAVMQFQAQGPASATRGCSVGSRGGGAGGGGGGGGSAAAGAARAVGDTTPAGTVHGKCQGLAGV